MTNVFGLLPPTNGSLNNNGLDRFLSSSRADLSVVKIDLSFYEKHRISGGFDYDNTNTGGTSDLGPIFGSHTPQSTRYARISDNYVVSPTLVNQALVGYSGRFRGEVSNSLGLGYPAKIGLTGVQETTFPCIKWGDTNYNVNNCGDSQFADNVFQINDAVSWIKGKHSFKFGGEIRMLQFNVRRLTQSSSELDFAAAQTSSTGGSSGFGGNSVASSLFGLSDSTTLNYGNFSGVRYKDFALYAQDTYRFTSKLTLNYGLRYDIDLPASEAFDRFSMVDPTLPNPDAGNTLGAYTYFGSGPGRNGRKRPQDIYHKAFGPRLGFAYSINSKTVVRGGYGIYYEALKEGSFADQDGLGFFNRQTVNVTNGGPTQIDNGVTHIFPASGPFTPGGQNNQNGIILVPSNTGRPADIQTWNLDIQRQVTNNLMVSLAYVGSKGTHLPALNIIPNQANPSFLTLGSELTMPSSCLAADTCPKSDRNGIILVPSNTGRPADIQTWNLDIQRQVTNNLMVSLVYVGSKGTHLPALNIIPNQVNPSFLTLGSELTMPSSCLAADTCPKSVAAGLTLPYAGFTGNINQLLRPFPQYGNFNQEDNSFSPDRTGNSTYNAMQMQINKRVSEGLTFLVSYTVSKNITDADSAGPGVSGFIGTNSFIGENSYNRKAEKAVSQLDTPQSLVASFFYELPFGRGKRYLSEGGVVDRVVGGWYVSTIASYHSGTPTTVYGNCGGTAGDVLFGGCSQTGIPRVHVFPGGGQVKKRDPNPPTPPFLNPSAFSLPAQFTFGNEPRSLACAPAFGCRHQAFTL